MLRTALAQSGGAALTEVELRDNVSLITGGGSNVVVLRTAGAAALVDSGPPEHAEELAKLVLGRLGLLDRRAACSTRTGISMHTGGNEAAALRRHDRSSRTRSRGSG